MKPVAFMLLFGVVGFIAGTTARIVITEWILWPLIVPLIHPSAQTYGEAPIITVVGAGLQFGMMIYGGTLGYKNGKNGKKGKEGMEHEEESTT